MRKSDKKKNMAKVNLIAENKYLESKDILNEDRKENYLKMIQNPQVKKAYIAIYDMFSKAHVSVSKEGDSENIYVDTDDRDRLEITQNDVLSGKAESKAIEFQRSQHADTSNHVKNPRSSMGSNMGSRRGVNMTENKYLESKGILNEGERPLVTEDSSGELDLFNPSNWHSLASSVFDSRISQFNPNKTKSKAMSNDNKVLFLNRVLTEEQLGQSMGYITLDYGRSGYEIWTNNEPSMVEYLNRNGKNPDDYSFINSKGE